MEEQDLNNTGSGSTNSSAGEQMDRLPGNGSGEEIDGYQDEIQILPKNWYSPHQGGRPSSKGDAAKRWRDEETIELIRLWRENDILYNNKNSLYYNKEEKEKAVREIQQILANKDIIATFEQIWDKLTNLKCYYGSQKREMEHKRANDYKDYESPWKFYNYLTFLDDHLVQRKKRESYANLNDFKLKQTKRAKYLDDPGMYDSRSTVSPSMVHTYSSPVEQHSTSYWSEHPSMASITSTTSNVTTTTSPNDTSSSKSEDATFCELICKMLSQIPESEEKALLKIELQQRVIACRYRS